MTQHGEQHEQERIADVTELHAAAAQPSIEGETEARADREDVVREALAKHIKATNLSNTEVARRTGYSAPMISNFLAGKPQSARFIAAVEAMLTKELGTSPTATAHARGFVMTTAAARIIAACELAHRERVMTVIIGPPGAGKTQALRAFRNELLRKHKERAILFTPSPSCTKRTLLVSLLKELGQPANRSADELAEIAARQLLHTQRMLIVDEANLLNTGGLEMLRYLADHAKIPIVLAGTHRLLETFIRGDRRAQDLAQLYSRIAYKVQVAYLTDDELRAFAAKALGRRVDDALLEQVRKHTGGSIRLVLHLCARARELARLNRAEIGPKLLNTAARLIETGDGLGVA